MPTLGLMVAGPGVGSKEVGAGDVGWSVHRESLVGVV